MFEVITWYIVRAVITNYCKSVYRVSPLQNYLRIKKLCLNSIKMVED